MSALPIWEVQFAGIADEFRAELERRGVVPEQLFSSGRTRAVAEARAATMTLVRDRLGWSYPEIGRFFGRDHTTVIGQIRQHRARVAAASHTAKLPELPDLDVAAQPPPPPRAKPKPKRTPADDIAIARTAGGWSDAHERALARARVR